MPWIGKYWSSRRTVASGRPYSPLATISAACPEHRRPRAGRARPGAAPARAAPPTRVGTRRGRGRAASRRTPGSPPSTAARPPRGAPRSRCRPTRRRRRRRARRATRRARRRGGARPRAARSGSASKVAVSAASTSSASASCWSTYACTVPMCPHPTSPIRIIDRLPLGVAGSTSDAGPDATARRTDRAPRRPRARPRRGARRRASALRRRRRRGRARPARRRPALELRQRDAEQPDAARAVERVEQLARGREEHRAHVGRGGHGARHGSRVSKFAEADLQRDRARLRARPAAAGRDPVDEPHQLAVARRRASRRSTANVSSAPIDFASRSGTTARGSSLHASARSRCPSESPSAADERRLRQRGDLADRVHAHALEPAQRRRARRPRAAATGSGARNVALGARARRRAGRRAWPDRSRAWRGTSSSRRRPTRRARPRRAPARGRARAISAPSPSRRRAPRDVEERLVDRQLLHERRDRLEDRHHLAALLGVAVEARARRTPPCGHARRARPIGIAECTPNARAS